MAKNGEAPTPIAVCLLAEVVGTFVLTFTAAGADIVDQIYPHGIGHVARYIAPGIAVTAMIWALSGLSGAHINPAISFAFFLRRTFDGVRMAPYIAAQFIGAILASLTLRGIFAGNISLGITHAQLPFNQMQGFFIEIVATAFLALTILGTAEEKAVVGKNVALAVGGVVALCGLAFSPVSGASMNPARSLGPMIAAWDFTYALTYLIAPLIGASIAAGVTRLLYGAPDAKSRNAAQGRAA